MCTNCIRQQLENIVKEDNLEINFNLFIRDDKPYENIVSSIHAHKRALRYWYRIYYYRYVINFVYICYHTYLFIFVIYIKFIIILTYLNSMHL